MANTPDLVSIKLPYDVKLGGGGTFLKGVPLQSLVITIIRHASPEYQAETKALLDKIDVEGFKKHFPHLFKAKKLRDLASMMTKLDWKFRQQDNVDIEARAIVNDIEFYTTDKRWYIGKDIAKGTCISVIDGINQIEKAFVTHIEPFIDFSKLQQPEPFWRPIEECPKETGKSYFIRSTVNHFGVAE